MTKKQETSAMAQLQDNPDFLKDLQEKYLDYNDGYKSDPFLSPVFRLALDIKNGLENNEISFQQIKKTVHDLNKMGLSKRAAKMALYLGNCNAEKNIKRIDTLFQDLAQSSTGTTIPFDDFKKKVETLFYGFVFTAHPTFTMSQELSKNLSSYTAGLAGSTEHASLEELYTAADLPFSPPDIDDENQASLYAINNLHSVIERMLERLFITASDHYPNQWQSLQPRLFSLATWVGFDIDGRRDISWATTLEKRILLQLTQLRSYQTRFLSLMKEYPKDCIDLKEPLERVENTLTTLEDLHHSFAGYKQEKDNNLEELQDLSQHLISSSAKRLTSASDLIKNVQNILEKTTRNDVQIQLMMVLTQLRNFGLSRAEVHFRINSAQLHNAINDRINLETHPDHPTKRRQYIEDISKLINKAQPMNIDFGDIAEEEITAKYEFMLIQEITQYIDSDSPIRFLIAETESAFTVLTALYYAKLFGVADKIDICPLFETERALQDSSRYMTALLESSAFASYLKQRQRLCIQTGYSDAGRYIGQPAAGASIERLKERFIQLFKDHKIKDISLLFFDTHGESIGRGGHPESFQKRMEYIAPPYILSQTALSGISYTQESSYQGGDGFLNFTNKDTALSVLTGALEYWLEDRSIVNDDPYYQDPYRTDVTHFLTEATRFQLSLTSNPQYADLMFAFSTHMMNPSGSRAVKRQKAEPFSAQKKQAVTDIRAIPTNAILGQMGFQVNTVSGVGRATREYSDFLSDLRKKSPRFQTILSLINGGAKASDPQIMRAYISVLDPTLWITQASACPDTELSNRMATIATHLEQHGFYDGMMEVFRKIHWDYTLLNRFEDIETHQSNDEMACLHALRLALIQYIFVLATKIPRYSSRHPISRESLIKMIFHMDIDNVTDILKTVFPVSALKSDNYNFGETSQYRKQDDAEGYSPLQKNIITPMQEIHKTTKDISTALAHYIGFFG